MSATVANHASTWRSRLPVGDLAGFRRAWRARHPREAPTMAVQARAVAGRQCPRCDAAARHHGHRRGLPQDRGWGISMGCHAGLAAVGA
jgi:hypothetical protein